MKVLKIFLSLFYAWVLTIFLFIEIIVVYQQVWVSPMFILFVANFIIVVATWILAKIFLFKNSALQRELIYTSSSLVYIYIFMILGFFISQEYILRSFEAGSRVWVSETQLSGNLWFLFLSLWLFISPLVYFVSNIQVKQYLIKFRKILWILVFVIFLRHFIDFFQSHYPNGDGFVDYFIYFRGQIWYPVIWSGAIWGLIIVLLGITSNNISMKLIGWKTWKLLHKLVYPAYIFTVLHVWFLARIDWFYILLPVLVFVLRFYVFLEKRKQKKYIEKQE